MKNQSASEGKKSIKRDPCVVPLKRKDPCIIPVVQDDPCTIAVVEDDPCSIEVLGSALYEEDECEEGE